MLRLTLFLKANTPTILGKRNGQGSNIPLAPLGTRSTRGTIAPEIPWQLTTSRQKEGSHFESFPDEWPFFLYSHVFISVYKPYLTTQSDLQRRPYHAILNPSCLLPLSSLWILRAPSSFCLWLVFLFHWRVLPCGRFLTTLSLALPLDDLIHSHLKQTCTTHKRLY